MTPKEGKKRFFKKANGENHLALVYGNCLVCFIFRSRSDGRCGAIRNVMLRKPLQPISFFLFISEPYSPIWHNFINHQTLMPSFTYGALTIWTLILFSLYNLRLMMGSSVKFLWAKETPNH